MLAGGCIEHAGKAVGEGLGEHPPCCFRSLMLFSASLSLSLSLVNWTGEGQTDRYIDRQSNGKAKRDFIAGRGEYN